jgi:iron complex outermembrane receptor protein
MARIPALGALSADTEKKTRVLKYPRFRTRSVGRLAALLWALSSVGGAFAEEEAPAAEAAAPPTAEESASESVGGASAEEEAPAAEAAAPSTAEESASEGGTGTPTEGTEEITVTGERQSIDRQETPVSITAFSAEELQAFRVKDIADLSQITANLEIKTVFAASSPTLFIRGVGLQDYNANSAGAVTIYSDGVTINTPTGQLFSFFDVQNVEVFRGPQAVDSRNATAGAIYVSTEKPDGEFGASMDATYGNFNAIELEAAVGFPIFGDVLSGRISGRLNTRDGYVKNRCATSTTGICNLNFPSKTPVIPVGWDANRLTDKVNDLDNWAVRGQLRGQPGAWDWLLKVEGGQSRGDAAQFQSVGTAPNVPGTDRNGYIDDDGDPFAGDYNLQGLEKLDLFGASLRGSTEVAGVEFNSITGFFATERNVTDNCDANPLNTIHCFWSNESWQVSQELQIASYVGERLELSGGAFFLYEQLDSFNIFDDASPIRNDQEFEQTTISGALYARGGYELDQLLEGLRVEGGVRLNSEHKSFSITARTLAPSSGLFFSELDDTQSKTWIEPTGEAILRYHFNDDVNIYAKYSRGFKAGHFNGGAVDSQQLVSAVEPEFINAVEGGIRSLWWDGNLRFNGSLFFYDYTDLQVFELENADAGPPIPQLLNSQARVFGAEAEVQLTPLEGLFASLNFGWLDAEFTDFEFTRTIGKVRRPGPGGGVDRILAPIDFTDNTLISAPRFTLVGVLEYELELALFGLPNTGVLVPHFDFSFKDRVFFDGSNGLGAAANISPDTEVPPSVRLPEPFPENTLSQEAYWLFNARLAYRTPDGRIEVAGWVRNLTDERYLVDAFDLSFGFSKVLQIWGMRRTYGVTLSLTW